MEKPVLGLPKFCFQMLLIMGFAQVALAEPTSTATVLNDAARGALAKSGALDELKKFQASQKDELTKLDHDIHTKITESQSLKLSGQNSGHEQGAEMAMESRINGLGSSLKTMSQKRNELLARQKFIDQMIFQIDSKYSGQPLRPFLEQIFLDMATSEINESGAEASPNNLTSFLTFASIAIREIPEPTEDLIAFTIGYMNYASVLSPKTPLAYLNSRNYSNGAKMSTARAAKLDNIGQYIEKRLKLVEEMKLTPKDAEGAQEPDEDFDQSKVVKPKSNDKLKPSVSIIISPWHDDLGSLGKGDHYPN